MPLRSTPAFQFGQLKFDLRFSPRGFCGYFLSDTRLVTFTELCILLCYEVFVSKFRRRVSIFISFLSAILFALAQFCRSCQSFLILPFCTQFHRFALNFNFLHCWNCTVHWFGINWHVFSQSDCRNCCLYIVTVEISYLFTTIRLNVFTICTPLHSST